MQHLPRTRRPGFAVRSLAFLLLGLLAAAGPAAAAQAFRRADSNGDGRVDLSDGVNTLGFLFGADTDLGCKDAADADDSGAIDITDAIYTFGFLFLNGSPPPAPGLECGLDPTAARNSAHAGCERYAACDGDGKPDPIPGPVPPVRLGRGGALEIEVAGVSEFVVALDAAEAVTIEATGFTAGSPPVLHLLWDGPLAQDICEECDIEIVNGKPRRFCWDVPCAGGSFPAPGSEVARSGGPGTGSPRLAFTAVQGGEYRLVARSSSGGGQPRSCNLLRNGSAWRTGVPYGGTPVVLDGLRAGEQLHTVRLPNGAGPAHVVYALAADGAGIARRFAGGGIEGGVRYTPGTGSQRHLIGVLGGGVAGRLRFVRNDAGLAGHDPDGDGLGAELESAIGTCSALSGIATAAIPDWRLDLLENRATERCERASATPAEFDECFIEIFEFYQAYRTREFDCSLATDPRDTDGDGIGDGWEVLGRYASPGQPLPLWGADPRHKDLFVEVDFMVRGPTEMPRKMSPFIARDFARYYQDDVGAASKLRLAYRGATLVNPDGLPGIHVHLDTGVAPERPEDATVYGDWGGYTAVPPVQQADGSWAGVSPWDAWKTNMTAARLGIFRYAIPYASGGGSNPYNSFVFTGGLNGDAWVLAHESGHAMGLGHSGPPSAPGVNCKPNYPSIMNYAFSNGRVGFSDGLGAPGLNNSAVKEWKSVPPALKEYLDILSSMFRYWVDRDQGHVDWNRDGVIAPEGETVRAYANYVPGNSCEGTRSYAMTVPNGASIQSPAMARLGGRLYAFYSVLGVLRYSYTTSAWDCDGGSGEDCGTWSHWEDVFMNAGGGVDVERIGSGDRRNPPRLLVVTIDHDGVLWESTLGVDALGRESWTDAVVIPGSSPAAGEPSLAPLGACSTMLVYKGADLKIRWRLRSCTGWGPENVALTPAGAELSTWEHASPAICRAYLAWRPGQPALYGAFPDAAGTLRLHGFDAAAGRWEATSVLESTPSRKVEGRPAMAWVPFQADADLPGRFYLAYPSHDLDESKPFRQRDRAVMLLMSYVKVTQGAGGAVTKQEVVGLQAFFDNVWLHAFGIDFFHERGADSNLRALVSIAIDKPEAWATLQFRPKADGIDYLGYINYNDWETLGPGICRNVVNPGNLVSNPILCP